MREAGPCGACAVLCSRQRGQTSPELAHFWALGVCGSDSAARRAAVRVRSRGARVTQCPPPDCVPIVLRWGARLSTVHTQPHIAYTL
jgi:hypothetical protein